MNRPEQTRGASDTAAADRRLRELETQVGALIDAVEVLARGLENVPTAEPGERRPEEAARRTHELLLLAKSVPTSRSQEAGMTTARDIMHPGAECIGEHDTLRQAAEKMRAMDVGALPICGDDKRLHGIITDRDIVIKCIARGGDPATTTAGELAQGTPVTIDADADVAAVLDAMEVNRIRRLPVIESHQLVGIISEADVARHLPDQSVAQFVEAICAS